ncbi:hypothetical protein AOQ84DRAFT_406735 [Glonium stellatum]|uniref:DUF7703 domain-containing protein n=1 Tax=Glonium stellatum TaxID=574774 RepID=A0A8E2JT82_9PEZI|nr:hypothetical protein AOQ84DRAFT_406735 [Glonium stellatum]
MGLTDDVGISGRLHVSLPAAMAIIAFVSIAIYNAVELAFTIFMTFKRRSGLYFWSFVVATGGIVPYAVGFTCKFFQLIPIAFISVTLIVVGWSCMVTGQSVVLYSRLHLVVRNTRTIRWVLIMIIIDAFILHVPIIVFAYGSNSSNPGPFVLPYSVYEKVQITVFFIQEAIISGLYVYETVRILGPTGQIRAEITRKVLTHLIYVNIIIILLDITLLGIEYSGHYEIQTTYKATLYSVKLKLEFSILNRLVTVTQQRSENSSDLHRSAGRVASGRNVQLDTIIGSKRNRGSSAVPSNGYSAYAKMDDSGLVEMKGESRCVVKTTEVVIERSNASHVSQATDTRSDNAIEEHQVRAKGAGLEQNKGKPGRRSSLSVASSEVQFAEAGY